MSVEEILFRELAAVCAESRRGFDRHVHMSQGRRRVLSVLDEHPETGNAALRATLGTDGATLTRLLKGMEADGLVERRRDAADNRLAVAALTPAGREAAAALRTAHAAYQQELVRGITPEDRATAARVMRAVRANISRTEEKR